MGKSLGVDMNICEKEKGVVVMAEVELEKGEYVLLEGDRDRDVQRRRRGYGVYWQVCTLL